MPCPLLTTYPWIGHVSNLLLSLAIWIISSTISILTHANSPAALHWALSVLMDPEADCSKICRVQTNLMLYVLNGLSEHDYHWKHDRSDVYVDYLEWLVQN